MIFKFQKKAISPLIATILLIVVAVAIILIIIGWGKVFTTSSLTIPDSVVYDKSDIDGYILQENIKLKEVNTSFYDVNNNLIYFGPVVSNNLNGSDTLFDTIKLSPGEYRLEVSSDNFNTKEILFTVINCDSKEEIITDVEIKDDTTEETKDDLTSDVNLTTDVNYYTSYSYFPEIDSSKSSLNVICYYLILIIVISTIVLIYLVNRKKNTYFLKKTFNFRKL
jgi:hypothetical protein